MALTQDFYKEILEKEKNWIHNLQYKLLNAYYLPELKQFYQERQSRLNYESDLTGNVLIKSISFTLDRLIDKLDYFMQENQQGKDIKLEELSDYFLTSVLNNSFSYVNQNKLDTIKENKKNLYELRQQVLSEGKEDYLDDDFYYDNRKVA